MLSAECPHRPYTTRCSRFSLEVMYVSVIDLYGNTVTATVPVGKNPGGIVLAAG
jgi:DNA-binding beta-propeller fold protein YncE